MGEVITRGSSVDGVLIEPRKQLFDDRGAIMHVLSKNWPAFDQFGEVYVSLINEGVIKAWKCHRLMTQHFAVPVGEIKIIIYDDRVGSTTRGALLEIVMGRDHYGLVRIPPGVWYGFKGLGPKQSLIVNCASIPHDPSEVLGKTVADFPIPVEW